MGKQIIAVDADDTLFDENNAIRLFHNERYGSAHSEDDYLAEGEFGWFWAPLWGTDQEETERRYEEFIQFKLKSNLPPLPGALEVLRSLQERFELVVVTSRDERAVKVTHDALTEHYPDVFTGVHFAPVWSSDKKMTKAAICNEIGAAYLIDDAYHHCQLAAQSGVTALLFGEYGWNRTQELVAGMVRCKDWQAVKEYFDAQG